MARIAFLGAGNMGRAMAARLIEAGHELTLYNRTKAKAAPLVALGAKLADTPRAACLDAQAVISMVSDDEASKAMWYGEQGALAARLAPGTLAIECSTLSRDCVLALAERAKSAGLSYIDCPVTGLPDAAAAGKLTLLVGASSGDLEKVRPLLTPLYSDIIHFGPVGAGTAYKLMINLMGAVQIAAAAEGLAIAERAGLDLEQVIDALSKGQAASPQVVRNAALMVRDDHLENIVFSGRLRLKDTAYGVEMAEKLGLEAPFGHVAQALLKRLIEAKLGDLNESKIIEILRG